MPFSELDALCRTQNCWEGANWDTVQGGEVLLKLRACHEKKAFRFLAAELVIDEPTPQIAVETRDYTPTGRPSTQLAPH